MLDETGRWMEFFSTTRKTGYPAYPASSFYLQKLDETGWIFTRKILESYKNWMTLDGFFFSSKIIPES